MGKKRTIEEYINLVTKKHNGYYTYNIDTLREEFKNNLSYITITCPVHGDFKIMAGYHLQGGKCKQCNPNAKKNYNKGKSKKYSDKYFKQRMKEIYGTLYDFSNVVYTKATDYIYPYCTKHKETFKITPHDLLRGHRCPKCAKESIIETKKKPYEEFIKECNEIYNGKYIYTNLEYNCGRDRIKVICPIHGEFSVIADNHLRHNCGCPKCGKRKTHSENILFEKIKEIYSDTIHHYPIGRKHLDIYIPSIKIAIEYQGEQHFRPIKWFGGDEPFIKQTKRDLDKIQYCKDNGITLFHYTDYQIPKVFKRYEVITDYNTLIQLIKENGDKH